LDHLPSRERRDAEELLATFVRDAGVNNVLTEVVVIESFVTTAISKTLTERSTDLLVIGTEGTHEGIVHLLLGSNTEALMLGSLCRIRSGSSVVSGAW
jgi:nucleotide-binding universal stress UspA family protein